MNETISTILKGTAVGASMTVPGISGGTMAMAAGIYDRLISSVSEIFTDPKNSVLFLLKFSLGACAGILTVSRLMAFLLDTPAGIPLRFAFLGAVAGGIPLMFAKANLKKVTAGSVLLIMAGVCAVLILSHIPEGLFKPDLEGIFSIIMQLIGGFITAAALVLPGISASHMLYMLGIYEPVMDAVGKFDILSLLPLSAGLIIGVFLTARFLNNMFEKHTQGCYLVILGFMMASLRELIPAGADIIQFIIGFICALAGFIIVRLICGKEIKTASLPKI